MTKRFDVYWVNLDSTIGKEIKKTRPCIVVSPDELNEFLDTVVVVPITSVWRDWPFRISMHIGNEASYAAVDQVRTISKQRLGKKITVLSEAESAALISILQKMFAH